VSLLPLQVLISSPYVDSDLPLSEVSEKLPQDGAAHCLQLLLLSIHSAGSKPAGKWPDHIPGRGKNYMDVALLYYLIYNFFL